MKNKGKIIGLDFGRRRIGVAISDEDRNISFGRDCFVYKDISEFYLYIKDFINSENITKIVIGLPLNEEGEETIQTKRVEEFGISLSESVNLPVEYQDEYLTSVESDGILSYQINKRDKKRINHKNEVNILSAQKILQEYLNS